MGAMAVATAIIAVAALLLLAGTIHALDSAVGVTAVSSCPVNAYYLQSGHVLKHEYGRGVGAGLLPMCQDITTVMQAA